MPESMTPQYSPEAAALFNHANAEWRQGRWEAALSAYQDASTLAPGLAAARLGAARCLVRLGRFMAARAAFADTLRLEPAHYSAWLEAGHLCRQQGELQQAAGAYQRAIDAMPDRHEAHLAMARVLLQLGQGELSERAFQAALQRVPSGSPWGEPGQPSQVADQAEVAHRMGQYRLELGDAAGAVHALQLGLQALGDAAGGQADLDRPAELRIDLGEALWRLGQRDAALAVLTAASAATAEATLARLAALSFRFNLWQEAMAVSRRNVELHPHSAAALWNLAHLQAECWQMDEAETALARAEAIAPMPGARAMRASIAGRRGDADGALRLYRELAAGPGGRQYASSAAMSSLYSDTLSPAEVAALHRELFAPLGQGARSRDSFTRAPLAGRRLRLGLVTADFHHQHPVNIFMQPLLREFDRSRIELFVYFTGVSHDEQTRLAQRRAEHWVEATTLNDAQLARRIDADAIDLLLDLAGHTGQQRMSLFAQRAAPVQATYLGYPGSTGVPNIDWVIGDDIVTPAADDALCSERLLRLPETVFCYAPEDDYPYPRYTERHAQRPLTFGSFNNVPKLTPRTLALWARVLAAVPGSRLLLKAPSFGDASAVRAFSARLQALGVDLARVEFRGPSGLSDMMAEYADIDIALDPMPYNGGTTTLQSMWMGVPVLTLEGGHFVSRMGASFMAAAGLRDWVARDEDGYVETAVRMAADRTALLALKRGLRARLQALPAWNPVEHARAMENACFAMMEPSP
jgi:protein O-GlcNAc transferase